MAKRGPKVGHPPFAGCETGGAPKKYTPEFLESEAAAFEVWMKDSKNLWYEDFTSSRGYSPQRLSEFAQMSERFAEVYERSKYWQKSLLIRGGLLSKFNSSIVKLVLANTIGWTDKVESKMTGSATNPLQLLLESIDGQSKQLIRETSSDESE